MGANLDRLMKSYGVSTPTLSSYSGTAPTAIAADATPEQQGAYQGALAKYNAEKEAHSKYAADYKNRVMSTDLYSSPAMNIRSEEKQKAQWSDTLTTPDYSKVQGPKADVGQPGATPDYASMVNKAYAGLGRKGIGTEASNIDQAGYDYWMGKLKNGEISSANFYENFLGGAKDYIGANANDLVTKHVQGHLDKTSQPGNYANLINTAYAGVGRSGIGTGLSNVDQGGYDYWMNKLNSGAIAPDSFNAAFAQGAKSYMDQNPSNDYTKFVQGYLGSQPTAGTGTTGTAAPDYSALVNSAYGTLGRKGMGSDPSNIDQGGYNHWMDQLKSGAVSPSAFQSTFTNSANDWMAQNPDSAVSQYVQNYNRGNNYAHGGSVRHFARGGIGRVDGGINDLADKYAMDNPAELPEIYAQADTGTRTDAAPASVAQRTVGSSVSPPSGTFELTPDQLRGFQASARAVGKQPMQRGSPGPVEGAPVRTEPPASPAAAVVAAAAPSADAARDDLYRKYFARPAESSALVEARKKSADSQAAFLKAVNDQMGKTDENAPSKAEMYFRLAAALASPTKTGGIMENVALAAKELGDFQKSTTDAKRAAAAAKLQMLLKTHEITWQTAKEELAALEKAESEENTNRRTFGTELIKEQQKNREPKSELGRRAADEGFTPGTTAHEQRVSELSKADEAQKAQTLATQAAGEKRKAEEATKLSSPVIKLKTETEDTLARLESAAQDLKKAFALNPNTFAGSWSEKAEMFVKEGLGIKDPIAINTRVQRNLLSSQALDALKDTFPGAISNDERKALLDLQGVDSKTLEEREVIIKRAYQALQTSLARNKKRLESINKGEYSSTTKSEGAPSDGQ